MEQNSKLTLWFAHRLFSMEERIAFFERLAELLEANFSITNALRVYYEGYEEKLDSTDSRVVFLRDILVNMGEGKNFSAALSPWVSPTERILLESGEKSGHLAEALRSCGQVARNSREIKGSMKAQLIDPAINTMIFIGTAIYTATSILPVFTHMSNPNGWSGFLYWWYAISEFFKNDLYLVLIVLAVYAIFAWWTLPRLRDGPFRRVLEKLPPWNVYKRLQGAIYVDAMAAMLMGNQTPRQAIEKIQQKASPYLESKLDQALEKLAGKDSLAGKRAADIFDIGLLPDTSVVEISIYAQGKEFVSNLRKLALYNTQQTLQWISGRIGNIGMLVDLLAVGYTSLSLLAMLNLQNALGAG